MAKPQAILITLRLDTGVSVLLTLRGLEHVSLDLVEQDERAANVTLQYRDASFRFPSIARFFRALAAYEYAQPTRLNLPTQGS